MCGSVIFDVNAQALHAPMKKVLLAEDHSLVIKGMKLTFETELPNYHLETTRNTAGLMKMLSEKRYDLAIIDIQLEDGDTLQLIPDIHRLYPELRILIFSGFTEELYAQRLYRQGIKGYVHKQAEDSEIIVAVHLVMDGKTYVSEKLKTHLLSRAINRTADPGKKN